MSGDENINSKQHAQEIPLLDEDIKIVISFDGGGTRGIISAIIAEAIENAAGIPLSQACDLLIGTSIGGITALLLATPDEENLGKPKFKASSIKSIYRDFSERVFSIPFSRAVKTLWGYDRCKYSNQKIKKLLEGHFQNVLLSQALTRVVVVAAEIEQYIPFLLKSYEGPDFYMKDAAIATSAAPTFFPVAKVKSIPRVEDSLRVDQKSNDYYFIDGKLTGSNNPALLGYAEICSIYNNIKNIKDKVIVISIGAGKTHRTIHYNEVAEGGVLTWIPLVFPLMGELANETTDYQMEHLLKDIPAIAPVTLRRYWRLQPNIPEQYIELDTFSDQKLTDIGNIAKNYVLEHKREIQAIGALLSHRARYLKNNKN